MEIKNNLEKAQESQVIFSQSKPGHKMPFVVQITLFSITSVAFILLSFFTYYSLKNISKLQSSIDTQGDIISNQAATIDKLNSQISTIGSKYDLNILRLRRASFCNDLDHAMSEGLVTDQIVAQRVNLVITENNILSGNIDIRPQPIFAYHFLGQGRFDLQDRELRATITGLIDRMKGSYDELAKTADFAPKFENAKIYITENNYDVAIYENNQLKLSGEK